MGFKDILVHADGSERSKERIRFAAELAIGYDAHLTGYSVVPRPNLPGYIQAQLPDEILRRQVEDAQEILSETRKHFEALTNRPELKVEWQGDQVHETLVYDTFTRRMRSTDLAIVGQDDPKESAPARVPDLAEEVVLAAGRPMIIVPRSGQFKTPIDTILVAWNGSRESARAVNDSLPMLRRAKSVILLTVRSEGDKDVTDQPSLPITHHLARHGVPVEAATAHGSGLTVGQTILARADDAGADMVVMGAYGRSRLRELVLGGATRELLRNMTMPVFMTH